METLPDDVLMNEILGRLSFQEILEWCSASQQFARICQNDQLWHFLTLRDFPHEVSFNPGISWRQYYFEVLQSPILPVYFYEDPIEWIRLTPYNIKKVVRLIQSLKQRLGVPEHLIVFTDNYTSPLASVVEGKFNVIDPTRTMQKIVLLRPGREISEFSIIKELISMNPQSKKPLPMTGRLFTDGDFFLTLDPPERYEFPGKRCVGYQRGFLTRIMDYLGMKDEIDMHDKIVQSGGIPDKYKICHLIYERLRSMGRILDEVVPPNKPLLE